MIFVFPEILRRFQMFSGIVETTGVVSNLENKPNILQIGIKPNTEFLDVQVGDSVSVNGACLTVTHFSDNLFYFTAVNETLQRTNLKDLALGDLLNLERSLQVGSRIGGHYVQGHIDIMTEIIDMQEDAENTQLIKVATPYHLSKYIVNKGYITLDGMSLTVIESQDNCFTLTLIPHTKQSTIAQNYKIGTHLNLEVDILGKYAEKLLRAQI